MNDSTLKNNASLLLACVPSSQACVPTGLNAGINKFPVRLKINKKHKLPNIAKRKHIDQQIYEFAGDIQVGTQAWEWGVFTDL